MPDDNFKWQSPNRREEKTSPSDHVLLEADLIAGLSEKEMYERTAPRKKSILIYCQSHDLLREISNELKSVLDDDDVEILTCSDKIVALKLLKSGGIDLLLHGPASTKLVSVFDSKTETNLAFFGSALILIHNPDPATEAWINDIEHSRHLTKAISRLNGSRSVMI
ncbi:hypothetical protein BH23BAC3_BH23BAC3_12670 [soil metagenome]